MSPQLSATTPAAGGPSDVAAAAQRVQQLQALIARAQSGASAASSGSSSGSPGSFAAALSAASSTPAPTGVAASASFSAFASPTPAPTTGAYDALVQQAAARYGLDPALLHGLIQQESGFDPNAHSSAGAAGLTQLMPGTASSLGVSNPLDPAQSIDGGARYLSGMLSKFGGNTEEALAAYNAGPGAVQRYGGVPPYAETQNYVSKVLGYANAYRQSSAGTAAGVPA
ncbi:MAG TPA: lytic transglycosylase domain-containing protein [Solirubrobacteraceae bacterium]|nr:lytic transglycosylase domain-containing protein [Solirubrobacteraceae bacterium]